MKLFKYFFIISIFVLLLLVENAKADENKVLQLPSQSCDSTCFIEYPVNYQYIIGENYNEENARQEIQNESQSCQNNYCCEYIESESADGNSHSYSQRCVYENSSENFNYHQQNSSSSSNYSYHYRYNSSDSSDTLNHKLDYMFEVK